MANEDCYFYYYSTCKKGSTCPFRHEPLSRGTESICEDWEFGKCMKKHCELRHMRIQVNRSTIECYWESQPAGCQKPHCVFKHSHTRPSRLPEMATPTSEERENTASPKVDQILINVADTDEDSPQKPLRVKSAVSNHAAKKVLLKQAGQRTDATTDLKRKNVQPAKNSSELLEEELLEFAKKGVCINPGADTSQKSNNGNISVKVKSLKEIKREKILRARLEYERKKLLAKQQLEVGDGKQFTESVDMKKVQLTKTPSLTTNNEVTVKESLIKRITAPSHMSEKLEVSNQSTTDIGNVKIKSFSEIMEEKRQRLAEVIPEVSSGDTKESETVVRQRKPVIAARKMRINSSGKRKPVRLKRMAPPDLKDEVLSKSRCQHNEEPATNSNNDLAKKSIDHSEMSSTELSDTLVTTESKTNLEETPSDSALTDHAEVKTGDDRVDLDIEHELDLLDSSSYLNSHASTKEIDDDDLMNEMEQLLA